VLVDFYQQFLDNNFLTVVTLVKKITAHAYKNPKSVFEALDIILF
jgi:hypothetical protein